MEQTKTSSYTGASLKRPRPLSSLSLGSQSIQVPRVKPIAALTMSYNHRPLSPGGRRLQNPARLSDNTLSSDSYYSQRHNSYASPRASTSGVIPISTQTFINVPPPQNPRPLYDSYSGRPRRSSLVDTSRAASSSTTQLPSRTRPTVIQQDIGRPASPTKITTRDTKDYYVTPASSQEPRTTTTTHKKLYSVDGDGSAKLVADVNIPVEAGGNRHHKRRDSVERGGYRSVGVEQQRDRGRRGPGYPTNGTHNRPRDKSIDDEDAYSYTDAAGMYRDTEPRWREVRPRRGSVDRGLATSRERPVSVIDPTFGQRQPPAKEVGPPPSTRGWDKINDNLGRTSSMREQPRVAQSPTRGRAYTEYTDPRDSYYAPPRTNSSDRRTTVHQPYDAYEYDHEPRRQERRHSITRNDNNRPDRSVERRGFGIAPIAAVAAAGAFRDGSQTRPGRGDARGSDESFERNQYRDSGYAVPSEPQHRRDTAPEHHQYDYQRLEQEKRDREYAQRLQAEERDRPRERDVREVQQPRRDERVYDREPDRERDRPRDREYERDRERERERARQMEPPPERDRDRDRERHHERRGTDRGEHGRKENSPRQSGEALTSKTGLSQAATGGLAGAAAAFGLTGLLNKVSDKRDKDKERDDEKDRDRERDRERDKERERHERRREEDRERDRERDRRPASDEPPYERQQDRERERQREQDKGLGFAFEAPPEPPKSAPPMDRPPAEAGWPQERPPPPRTEERVPDRAPERASERVSERPTDRAPEPYSERPSQTAGSQERSSQREPERDTQYDSKPTAQMPATPIDPDEDYRRRMEQIQRELGRNTESSHNSDSDPDRERRRREREQRRRERESRNGGGATAQMPAMPGAFTDDVSTVTGSSVTEGPDRDLRRKPSILDGPMTNEPAQIIDNSMSDKRENRVRIVDPPTAEEEERRPKGILKKPTEKFPEHPDAIREGVAPLKDVSYSARAS